MLFGTAEMAPDASPHPLLVEMGLEMGHMVQIITPTDSINLWFCRVITWLLGRIKLIKEDMKHKTYL